MRPSEIEDEEMESDKENLEEHNYSMNSRGSGRISSQNKQRIIEFYKTDKFIQEEGEI
jgi:hypothetical protein